MLLYLGSFINAKQTKKISMNKYLKNGKSNYDKHPTIKIEGINHSCSVGWRNITATLNNSVSKINKNNKTLVVDNYLGVINSDIISALKENLNPALFINAAEAMLDPDTIDRLVYPDVTDDEIFGYLTRLNLIQFFDNKKILKFKERIKATTGLTIVYGIGASLICKNADILVYSDMARWEIQMRFRRNEISNLGVENKKLKSSLQYKRAFFVDWRVLDRHKKTLMKHWDYVLDTNTKNEPKMLPGNVVLQALEKATKQPFRLVPFFDPGPWGGQWMKEVCDLDKSEENFAWCFDCVPEENSMLLQFGDVKFEIPSINLVFYKPKELMGDKVHARFGDEFPIRFDFLDTMEGGNLSLQVHPLTEYIQEKFGMHYTQDESYYILEAEDDAHVFLGLRDDVDPEKMIRDLSYAQENATVFNAEKHVQKFDIKKHDHVLIPAGTVHCSGKNSMVLEISATPYIFTFKLYDWGRMGMDGKPRPINIKHGEKVIDWSRTKTWSEKNIFNKIDRIGEGDGWIEERTGLHELEFIETRRHFFSKTVLHKTTGSVAVLNLIEGREALVESPSHAFEPFIVHYAETFVIPAAISEYTIRPYGESLGKTIATLKAYVRG